MEEKKSPAFLRTDRAITEAFIRLLEEMSFESITVQDILDETPVTRSTFYAHFRDKYEIAERMQAEYLQTVEITRSRLAAVGHDRHAETIRKISRRNMPMLRALLKIRTERVDIRRLDADMYRAQFLASHNASQELPYPEASAEIYAQVMAAFHVVSYENAEAVTSDTDYFDRVCLPAMLAVFKLEDNKRLTEQIRRCLK